FNTGNPWIPRRLVPRSIWVRPAWVGPISIVVTSRGQELDANPVLITLRRRKGGLGEAEIWRQCLDVFEAVAARSIEDSYRIRPPGSGYNCSRHCRRFQVHL